MIKKFFLSLLVFAGLFFNVAHASVNNIDFNEYISDGAYVFSDVVVENLNKTINDLQAKTGAEVLVVTLKDLNNESIDSYLNQIEKIRSGGVIKAEHKVVLLFALKENYLQMFFDDWFEGKISPNELKKLGDTNILPYFNSGEYDKALALGVYSISKLIAKIDNSQIDIYGIVPPVKNANPYWWIWLLLIPIVAGCGVTGWILVASSKKRKEG